MSISIICISLPDSTERRSFMAAQFKELGLPYRFLDAIRPDLSLGWPAIYQRKKRIARYGYDLTQGEIGAYLSHRKAWQEFLDSGNTICCFLEDDVDLQPHFNEGLAALCRHAEKWDIVRLYGIFEKQYNSTLEFMPGYWLIDYFYQPSGLQGYLLNRKSAKQLLAYTDEMYCAIDDMVDRDWEHRFLIYGVKPHLVNENQKFISTIGNRKRPKFSIWKKINLEFHRSESDFHKRCWVLSKRLYYIIKRVFNYDFKQ